MNQITVMGMVISSTPIGEFDKRVVLLTKEKGKISAFARGARKPHSPLVGGVMPFAFGEFTLYEGRSAYTLSAASISNYFAELREDIEGAYYGFYFLEIANYYCKEANDEKEMLKLLYVTFRALAKNIISRKLIRFVFELKTLCINGEGPEVFRCLRCGDNERPAVFSAKSGGWICNQCGRQVYDGMVLDTSTWHSLQYIVSSPVEKLYTFQVSEMVLRELRMIMERYMEIYVDKSFKSLEILDQIT